MHIFFENYPSDHGPNCIKYCACITSFVGFYKLIGSKPEQSRFVLTFILLCMKERHNAKNHFNYCEVKFGVRLWEMANIFDHLILGFGDVKRRRVLFNTSETNEGLMINDMLLACFSLLT